MKFLTLLIMGLSVGKEAKSSKWNDNHNLEHIIIYMQKPSPQCERE